MKSFCRVCLAEYELPQYAQHKLYCSRRCKLRAKAYRREPAAKEFRECLWLWHHRVAVCEDCGTDMIGARRNRRRCNQCNNRSRHSKLKKTARCASCFKWIKPNQLLCSRCEYQQRVELWGVVCNQCGQLFQARSTRSRYCSNECGYRATYARRRARLENDPDYATLYRSQKNARDRARMARERLAKSVLDQLLQQGEPK